MVGHVGGADGAEIKRIEVAQLVVAAGRHHDAVLLVIVRAPVEVGHVELEAAVARGAGLEHLEAGRDHLRPDTVAGNGGDLVGAHHWILPF